MNKLEWRKSSRSTSNGQCVEVATATDRVMVRDSKDPHGPTLAVTRDEWRTFLAGLRR